MSYLIYLFFLTTFFVGCNEKIQQVDENNIDKATKSNADHTRPSVYFISGPSVVSNSRNAIFNFSAEDLDSGLKHIQCALDSDNYTVCTSPISFDLEQGEHELKLRAIDNAHNFSEIITHSWVIELEDSEENLGGGGSNTGDNPMPVNPTIMVSYNQDLSNAKKLDGATLERQVAYFFLSDESAYQELRFYCCKLAGGSHEPMVAETTAPYVLEVDLASMRGGERELYLDAIKQAEGYDYDSYLVNFNLKNDTSGGSTGGGSSQLAYYSEDFESGSKTNSGGFSWSSSTGVSTEQAYSGAHSLKFSYGPNAPGEDDSAEQRFVLVPNAASAPREVWIEYMLRVPNNFTHRSESPSNNKLFAIWAENYSKSGDVQTVFEYERSSSTTSHLRVLCMSGSGCLKGNYNSHILDTSMRGKWVRIRIHLKAGTNDGQVELWRDNTLVYSIYNYQHHFSGGRNYWRKGYLMGWSNSGYTEQTNFYVDDFKVYDVNPQW